MDKQADAALKRAIGMLEAILVRETEVHREMLGLAEAKQQAIVQGNIESLEQTVFAEKKLVARIEEEEKKRLAVMPLVKAGLGAGDGVEKLADVIALMPEPERTRMNEVRSSLKEALEACQIKTRHNTELLKASLEHVDTFLRSLADAASQGNITYKPNGKRQSGGPGRLDHKA